MDHDHPFYKWIALSNTTLGTLLATINASIVLISLPAIFRGIGLNPLAPGNVSYLLWMLMGYLVVTAVLVVPFGRLGDMFGRVRIYNLGFASSPSRRSRCPSTRFTVGGGALWLIVLARRPGRRRRDADGVLGGDPDRRVPSRQRGMALGVNMVAAVAGSFLGLLDRRIAVRMGLARGLLGRGTGRHPRHDLEPTARCANSACRTPGTLDWAGNVTFGVGLTFCSSGSPTASSRTAVTTGWTQPVGARSRSGSDASACRVLLCRTASRSADGRHAAVPVRHLRGWATWPG